ncbi:Protein of unknown function [Sulfurivirga caldicuralii]|uniref:DUF3018 domain-containing protein n=1 Tax=Sulfurivirga caldicuralii TaxID=364032 RepID=A0A1N6GHA9_9GAMM|nr:antitoxin MazE family protein [Sulfurivirga caldicuralii]SIO06929.1 Protein of unknown function [Sulfurivirga caldicuralii]
MTTASERVRRYREKMRAEGFRLVQLWVPDTRSEAFRRQCREQSLRLKNDPNEADTLTWIEHATDTEGWTW